MISTLKDLKLFSGLLCLWGRIICVNHKVTVRQSYYHYLSILKTEAK